MARDFSWLFGYVEKKLYKTVKVNSKTFQIMTIHNCPISQEVKAIRQWHFAS